MKDRGNDPNLESFIFGGGTSESTPVASPLTPEAAPAREHVVRRDGDYALIEKANGDFVVRDFSAQAPSGPATNPAQATQAAQATLPSGASEFNLRIRRDAATTSAEISFSNDATELQKLFGSVIGVAAGGRAVQHADRAIGYAERLNSDEPAAAPADEMRAQIDEALASAAVENARGAGALSLRGLARNVWRHRVGATLLAAACVTSVGCYEAYGLASGGEHPSIMHPVQSYNMIKGDFDQLINHPFGTIAEQAARI